MQSIMVPIRSLLHHAKPSKLLQSSTCFISPSLRAYGSVVSVHRGHGHRRSNSRCEFFVNNQHNPTIPHSSSFHMLNHHFQSQSDFQSDKDKIALLSSQMNMRLLNENSFLSWCRNAYLSSVVGIAMMEEATSSLGQTAGFGAFLVGGMNVFWGTSCHVINLVRLRHAAGMSGFTLTLNVLGSCVHCVLWLFVLTCYIGFLDDPEYRKKTKKKEEADYQESDST